MKRIYLFLAAVTIVSAVIRFVSVSQVPPGLYIDEVSNGYNAYTILTHGVDEHGVAYPLWFEAFGEFKMPVMIYMIAGVMAFIGKSELAVRLPSIVFGTLSVPLLFGILHLILKNSKQKIEQYIPYVASSLLAITPWHIHFSRGGFEATIALFLLLLGIFLFLLFLKKPANYLIILSVVSVVLSAYTYNAYRLIAPLFVLLFLTVAYISHTVSVKKGITVLFVFCLLFLPVVRFSLSSSGEVRFAQTSVLSTYKSTSFTEKLIRIPMESVNNYMRYFSPEFIFAVGDQNGRHQVPGMGLLFRWEAIFLVIGVFGFFTRKHDLLTLFVLPLLIITPIPAALTIPSPHSLRSLPLVLPLTVFVSFGIVYAYQWISWKRLYMFGMSILILAEGAYFAHLYFNHYSKVNILDWGGGYKEVSLALKKYHNNFDHIVVDRKLSDTEIYSKFYAPEVTFMLVEDSWKKPEAWKHDSVLLVRPDYGEGLKPNTVDRVYLKNQNHDIFAKLLEL